MTRLMHSRWLHQLLRLSRLPTISREILKRLSPSFRFGRIQYRVRSPESFSVAREVFGQDTYGPLLSPADVHTFIDLGCNTGYFTCLLAERYGPERIEGVLVDADPNVLRESEWHLRKNGISKCRTRWALVGPVHRSSADFYVREYSISSSAIKPDGGHPFCDHGVQRMSAPVVTLKQLVDDTFGPRRVSVLKIDIEGSEADLLLQNLSCLHQVDRIVLEWHKWVVGFQEIADRLSELGFTSARVLKEDSVCGLALFENTRAPSRADTSAPGMQAASALPADLEEVVCQ